MVSTIITALVGVLCTILSSAATFFLTRRKYNSEVDSQVVKNVKDAFEAYKKVMEETLNSQNEKIQKLQSENTYLKKQFELMQSQLVSIMLKEKLYPHIEEFPTNKNKEQ
jgi:cell shape-determining protein MreC